MGLPVMTTATYLDDNRVVKVWAGWKFSTCFFAALVNFGFSPRFSSLVFAVSCFVLDLYASMDPDDHWTAIGPGLMMALDFTNGMFRLDYLPEFGVWLNILYALIGISLLSTGVSPLLSPTYIPFLIKDRFALIWAGWTIPGCLYYALVNSRVDMRYCNLALSIGYLAFDVLALLDNAHWTLLVAALVVLDASCAIMSLRSPGFAADAEKEELEDVRQKESSSNRDNNYRMNESTSEPPADSAQAWQSGDANDIPQRKEVAEFQVNLTPEQFAQFRAKAHAKQEGAKEAAGREKLQ